MDRPHRAIRTSFLLACHRPPLERREYMAMDLVTVRHAHTLTRTARVHRHWHRIDAFTFDSSELPTIALNDASWTATWTQAVIDRLKAHARGAAGSGVIYLPRDDILRVRLSRLPVARDGSPDRLTHVACAADGSVVEVVLRQARSRPWLRPHLKRALAPRKRSVRPARPA